MALVVAKATLNGEQVVVAVATTREEHLAAFRLRKQVYVDDLGILPQDHPYVIEDRLEDHYDPHSTQILATVNGEAIGTARITWGQRGAMEIEESLDLGEHFASDACLAEATRLMVRSDWRRRGIGPLLAFALWEVLQSRSERVIFLTAGKVGNLGRYYQNAGYSKVGAPPFTYGLTQATYELLQVDIGEPHSLRRASWHLRAAAAKTAFYYLRGAFELVHRRKFRSAEAA